MTSITSAVVLLILINFTFALPASENKGPTNWKSMLQDTFNRLGAIQKGKCNKSTFEKCTTEYAKAMGYPSGKLPHAQEFVNHIDDLFRKEGMKAFKTICGAGADFVKCMGPAQFKVCMTIPGLVSMGVSEQDAGVYVAISSQLKFECQPQTLKRFAKDGKCITEVANKENSTLQGCTQQYISNLQKHPTEACKYTREYVVCYIKPFFQKCNRDSGDLMCEVLQAAFNATMKSCPIVCGGGKKILSMPILTEYVPSRLYEATDEIAKAQSTSNKLASGTCNVKVLETCSNMLAASVGVQGGFPYNDPTPLINALLKLQNQGTKGLMQICNILRIFRKCMGNAAGYNKCINVPTLENLGVSTPYAYYWTIMFKQLNFQCGPGLGILLNNYQCLIQENVKAKPTLDACQKTYNKQIQNHPTIQQLCMYSQQLLQCISKPFTTVCGKTAGNFVCMVSNIAMKVQLPFCQLKCSMNNLPKMIGL